MSRLSVVVNDALPQARSTEQPALDGAWMRAFDFEKWEAWASDADIGWGAWSAAGLPLPTAIELSFRVTQSVGTESDVQ